MSSYNNNINLNNISNNNNNYVSRSPSVLPFMHTSTSSNMNTTNMNSNNMSNNNNTSNNMGNFTSSLSASYPGNNNNNIIAGNKNNK